MDEQDNSFFRAVTSAVCSSVDIATSLHRALLVLRQRIPIDLMIVWVYDEAHGGLRKIALASEEGGSNSNEKSVEICDAVKLKIRLVMMSMGNGAFVHDIDLIGF